MGIKPIRHTGNMRLLCVWLCVTIVLPLAARQRVVTPRGQLDAIERRYADSLRSLAMSYRTWKYTGADTLSNPLYFPLFAPPVFYTSAIDSLLRPGRPDSHDGVISGRALDLNSKVNMWLAYAYLTHPQQTTGVASDEEDEAIYDSVAIGEADEIKADMNLSDVVPAKVMAEGVELDWASRGMKLRIWKPDFWTLKVTDFSLQFMQSYISSNWHKGGESSNTLQASLTAEANYNNKQRLTFDNKLEMKLGFQRSRGDDLHRFKTNSDQLRLTNKLGVRATTRWYYTFLLQSWTQFHPSYKSNDPKVYSDFMSPFESVFSIGMGYKLSLSKFNLSATLAPLACDFKYVDRLALSTSFGLKEGRHSKFEYGSNVTVNYTWNVFKNVSWTGRFYWYTDYSRTLMEWENTVNFTINRFLSAKAYLYPRFDDSVSPNADGSYFQFLEQLSLGLSVSF